MNSSDLQNFWRNLFTFPATKVSTIEVNNNFKIYIKRDDLNHPIVQGNKLRKLKYNFAEAILENYNTVFTFGGSYSNHILATAKAAKECGLSSIGVIRGEELAEQETLWSPTLIQAQEHGMKLYFVDRKQYRMKQQSESVVSILNNLKEAVYILPEGGSNKLAIKGVAEIVEELERQISQPDYIFLACGTGGTLAGIIDGVYRVGWNTKVCGIAVLKAGDSIKQTVQDLSKCSTRVSWKLFNDYHFGGYAKKSEELINFSRAFSNQHKVPLDKVYTSKVFFAVNDLIARGEIKPASKIVIIHTGGLQGGEF